jgi:hypothetical protein
MNLDKADPRGTGWNCIVGTKFGAYVTHEIKTYAYFSVAQGAFGKNLIRVSSV